MKLALGGRWCQPNDFEYDDTRLKLHNVRIRKNQVSGRQILLCGMSAKAAISWGLEPEAWERKAIERLRAVGATVIYRPKPSWPGARPLDGSIYDRSNFIEPMFDKVHGVVSHHSNAAIDALAAGLPIFVEIGIAKPLSVPRLEDIVKAEAPSLEDRMKFLRQVAWHQWTLSELAAGVWLNKPAPLASNPIFEMRRC